MTVFQHLVQFKINNLQIASCYEVWNRNYSYSVSQSKSPRFNTNANIRL